MSDLVLISPSQVRTFRECARKWAFDKIDKIPVAQSAGAAFGSLVHERLEGYFALGREVGRDRAGRIAHVIALQHPEPRPDMLVEHQLVVEAGGFAWRGIIDLAYERDGVWVVSDHKTLRQPQKYALDEEALLGDEQAVVYAHLAQEHLGVDRVLLQWTYASTQGAPAAFPVHATVDRAHVGRHLPALERTALQILEARRATTANDLPPTPSACGNYGGCPYAEYCVLSREDKLQGALGEKKMGQSLREILKQRAANNGAGKKLPPPRPSIDVNSPEAPETEQERVEISRRVGGGEDPRELTEAAAETRGLGPGAAREQKLVEAFRRHSPQQYDVLVRAGDGPARFSRRKSNDEFPFAHGRTLTAMVKAGLVELREVSKTITEVEVTDKGREKAGLATVVQAVNEATREEPRITNQELADRAIEIERSAPPGDVLAGPALIDAEDFDDAPPPGVTARDVWLKLAMRFGDKPEIVTELYGQYLRHFPTG